MTNTQLFEKACKVFNAKRIGSGNGSLYLNEHFGVHEMIFPEEHIAITDKSNRYIWFTFKSEQGLENAIDYLRNVKGLTYKMV